MSGALREAAIAHGVAFGRPPKLQVDQKKLVLALISTGKSIFAVLSIVSNRTDFTGCTSLGLQTQKVGWENWPRSSCGCGALSKRLSRVCQGPQFANACLKLRVALSGFSWRKWQERQSSAVSLISIWAVCNSARSLSVAYSGLTVHPASRNFHRHSASGLGRHPLESTAKCRAALLTNPCHRQIRNSTAPHFAVVSYFVHELGGALDEMRPTDDRSGA